MDAATMTLHQPSRSWVLLIALILLSLPSQFRLRCRHPSLVVAVHVLCTAVMSHGRWCGLRGIGRGGAGDVAMSLQFSSFGNTDEAIYAVEV